MYRSRVSANDIFTLFCSIYILSMIYIALLYIMHTFLLYVAYQIVGTLFNVWNVTDVAGGI